MPSPLVNFALNTLKQIQGGWILPSAVSKRCVEDDPDYILTQQLVQQVQNVLPGRSSLMPSTLPKMGSAVVDVQPIDTVGHQI